MACHMRITGIPIEQSPSCILSLISIEISYLIIVLSGLNESQDKRFKSKKQIIFFKNFYEDDLKKLIGKKIFSCNITKTSLI